MEKAGASSIPPSGLASGPVPNRAWLWEAAVAAVAFITIMAAVALPSMVGTVGMSVTPAAVSQVRHALPAEFPSTIGALPFDGPVTTDAIYAACVNGASIDFDCLDNDLAGLLAAKGSEVAFGVLENLTHKDAGIERQSHPIAHGLGRAAVTPYGGPRAAIAHCPYVLSSGCFHGVLQGYFDTLSQMDPDIVAGLCLSPDSMRQFQCLHGMGHGLLLFTNYDMNQTLAYCDYLPADGNPRDSCYAGAFMENLVGYQDSLQPTGTGGGHNHGGKPHPPPHFMLKVDDPAYPCDVVAATYQNACYYFQTSVTLQFNGGDFPGAAKMCQAAPTQYHYVCYQSLGRDVSYRLGRDVQQAWPVCRDAGSGGMQDCVKGVVAEIINSSANPEDGLAACHAFPSEVKTACYSRAASMWIGLLDRAGLESLCARTDPGYQPVCRLAAGLG